VIDSSRTLQRHVPLGSIRIIAACRNYIVSFKICSAARGLVLEYRLRSWRCYGQLSKEDYAMEIFMATDEQGAMSFLDRAGFGSLFLTAMLTIGIIGSIYICFLAR
jgi:hypothetical protein